MHRVHKRGVVVGLGLLLATLTGCSSSSGGQDASVKACEAAMALRTQSGTIEEREELMDETLLQARMSKDPGMVAVVEDADANAMGTIAFTDVVTVCRDLGYNIPDRE